MSTDIHPEAVPRRSESLPPQQRFIPKTLPWIVAAAAMVCYLLTLNRWLSADGIEVAARIYGWTWQPMIAQPIYWLVTLPLKLLPAKLVPLGLNLLSAVCGTLILCLLARSVALLPFDRTEQQRQRERSPGALLSIRMAWLPPLVAAIFCGWQLTFWENATAASAEIFDLLLFSYVIRCLLEFRVDARQAWLTKATFVFGAGMTNNWAMIGFLPLFVVALVWVKGLSFFNLKFLGRTILWGLLGLCFYLLLPGVLAVTGEFSELQGGFWLALKQNIGSQKYVLTMLLSPARLTNPDAPLWTLGLGSLLPVLLMAIRWPAFSGDSSRLGIAVSDFAFHLVHGVILVFCLWIALDPPMSPRNLIGLPGLTLYYLGALSIGYFAGHFLLVFGVRAPFASRQFRELQAFLSSGVVGGIILVLAVSGALLFYRNLPQVRIANGGLLSDFAVHMQTGLPAGSNTVVLSDDSWKLHMIRASLLRSGSDRDYLFVHTGADAGMAAEALRWPPYHRHLRQEVGSRWPVDPPKQATEVPQALLVNLMFSLAQSNQVFYIHPSFGYYFEAFYPIPLGAAYRLEPFPTNRILAPSLSAEVLDRNLAFWDQGDGGRFERALSRILAGQSERRTRGLDLFLDQKLRLKTRPDRVATRLAGYTSRRLNYWAVELQRNGRLKEAEDAFRRALRLNPDNSVAELNLQANQSLQEGRPLGIQLPKSTEDLFKLRSWEAVMNSHGPFDEPTLCFRQGAVFVQNNNIRQGLQYLHRSIQLKPQDLAPRLLLARVYTISRLPDQALETIQEILAKPEAFVLDSTNELDLLTLQTSALLLKGDAGAAEAACQKALEKYPRDDRFLATASQAFLGFGYYTNALEMIDRRLQVSPTNNAAVLDKAYALIQCRDTNQLPAAITLLNRVITEENKNTEGYYFALANRAIAQFRSRLFDQAREDYVALEKQFPDSPIVQQGLGDIAYEVNDRPAALRHYELFLSKAQTNTPDATNILMRLQQLRAAP